jgi:hypothetical protein
MKRPVKTPGHRACLLEEHFWIKGHSVMQGSAEAGGMGVQLLPRSASVMFDGQYQSWPEGTHIHRLAAERAHAEVIKLLDLA